jgi:AmmeMemoRadiSam system protein B
MSIRKDAVAGQFYPASENEIRTIFDHYNNFLQQNIQDKTILTLQPRAFIVPHAGYVYSAFTANVALSLLKNTKAKRVVVIGPSHRVYLEGTSVAMFQSYETPLGHLTIDTEFSQKLIDRFAFHFQKDAHMEHSTEVQMPFIKHYLSESLVVELVYGKEEASHLAKAIEYILQEKENIVIISTDLSHYHDIHQANRLDNICLQAVQKLHPEILYQGCEACGKIGVEAMLIAAKKLQLKAKILDYRTSADASGDTEQVVGYMSAVFIE